MRAGGKLGGGEPVTGAPTIPPLLPWFISPPGEPELD
jgi:hypothetical protein